MSLWQWQAFIQGWNEDQEAAQANDPNAPAPAMTDAEFDKLMEGRK